VIDQSIEDTLRYVQHESRLAAYRIAIEGRDIVVHITDAPNLVSSSADVVIRWTRQLDGPRVQEIQLSPSEGPDTGYSFTVDPLLLPASVTPTHRTNDPLNWLSLIRQPNLLGLRVASWLSPASIVLISEDLPTFRDRSERTRWTAEARSLSRRGIEITYGPAPDRLTVPFRHDDTVIVSVNPNAESMQSGHFVRFDRRLREQALANGRALLLVGHQRLGRSNNHEPWMLPWLDRRTSGSHVVDPTNVTGFISETVNQLRPILDEVTQNFDRPQVFWYLGAAEYVPIIEILARDYPAVRWHLHLFWDFLVDRSDPTALRRFRELLARVELIPTVRLTVGTETLLDDFDQVLVDSPLTLLPDGPSVSITDDEALAHITSQPDDRDDAPVRVLCPGGHAVGKNWIVGATVLAELISQQAGRFEAAIRLNEAQATRAEVKLARNLEDDGLVEVVDGLLTDDELLSLLADADVVFLPYSAALFAHRSSGLLTEAIIAGSRIVCFKGTYLAWVVDNYSLGTSVSELAGVDACIDAITIEAEHAKSGDSDDKQARLDYLFATSWKRIYSEIMGGRP
jgi:hypothetical protein